MRKLVSLCLAIMLLLPILSAAVCRGQNELRQGITSGDGADSSFYIVRFSDTSNQSAINKYGCVYLAEKTYRVSGSELERLYAECADDILYSEPDAIRTLYELDDGAAALALSEKASFDASGVTVAVLDTGIDRLHTGFSSVTVKNGYDCTTGKSYIFEDDNGHGTKIAGVISSYAENVTILPIKVSDSQSIIYSSDLITALNYAAENGADIINMSFGGYTYSYAEQEAVDSAREKGCILIASSGNDGMASYGDSPNYPAAYEGVISVGSTDEYGMLSVFSQNSSEVDISACGEKVEVFENSSYGYDSGTSFSCAKVSAAAASCKKAAAGARFEFDEMMALIHTVCGNERTVGLGYGLLDTEKLIEAAKKPIITGLQDGKLYSMEVGIHFNCGSALLDGEEIDDGDTAVGIGLHVLTVENEYGAVSLSFRITEGDLKYNYNEYASFSEFIFENGTGYLDGIIYESGTHITSSGDHTFRLEDEYGRSVGEKVCPDFGNSYILGVRNGTVYGTPVYIKTGGKATLNGKEFEREAWVTESGSYTVKCGNNTVSFKLELNGINKIKLGKADAAVISEKYKAAALYTFGKNGFSIYSYDTGKELKFISANGLCALHSDGERLFALCNGRTYVYSFESLLSDSPEPLAQVSGDFAPKASALSGGKLYFISHGALFEYDGEPPKHVIEVGESANTLSAYENTLLICCTSADGESITLYDTESDTAREITISANLLAKSVLLTEEYIVCGRSVFSYGGKLLFDGEFDTALYGENGYIISRKGVYAESGISEIYPSPVISVGRDGGTLYLFDGESLTTVVSYDASFGGAKPDAEFFESHALSEFSSVLTGEAAFADFACGGGKLFVILKNTQKLFVFDERTLEKIETVHLKFRPASLSYTNGELLISFESRKAYAVYGEDIEYYFTSFIPGKLYSCGEYIFTISGGRVRRLDRNGNDTATEHIGASAIAVNGGLLYIASARNLSCYDPDTMQPMYSYALSSPASTVSIGNGYIAAGDTLISTADGSVLYSGIGRVYCFIGGIAVTENGIFDLSKLKFITNDGFASTVSDGAYVFTAGTYGIIMTDTTPLVDSHVSITDGALYDISVRLTYSGGIGFADGKKIARDTVITESGSHVFVLCLPLGITRKYSFSVIPALEGITVISHTRIIGTGEVLPLKISFLPEGASSVPLIFEADSDIAEISESGVITALSSGVLNVTVSTADRRFFATYTLIISDSALRFDEESGIKTDYENDIISRIKAGTTVEKLIKMSAVGGDISIYDATGKKASGIIKTGMTLKHTLDSGETEEYTLAVTGDIDGDGYITACDLYEMKKLLASQKYGSELQRTAADVNNSLTLTGNDLTALKYQLLFRKMFCPDPPVPDNVTGDKSVYSSAHIASDGSILLAVSVCPDCAESVTGRIYVSGAELTEVITSVGDCEVYNAGGFVSFIMSGDGCGTVLLKFRSTGDAEASFTLKDVTAKTGGGIYTATPAASVSLPYYASGMPVIKVENSVVPFAFEEDKYEYDVFVGMDAVFADVFVSLPEKAADISNTFLPENSGTVYVTLPSGEVYTLNIMKVETKPDTENRLSSLSLVGFELDPRFDPDTNEYTVRVPASGFEPNLKFETISGSSYVTVDCIGDKIIITVTSESGDANVYTVNVEYIPDLSDDSSEPDTADGEGLSPLLLLLLLIPASAAVTAVMMTVKKKKSHN